MFEPLHIRAYMQTGIVSDQFLPLDGIIQYFCLRDRLGFPDYSTPLDTIVDVSSVELPFEKKEKDGFWYYACSFAIFPPHTKEFREIYSKRFPLSRIDMLGPVKKKINTQGGRYKSLYLNVYYRTALWLDWFCVGDRKEIERLLPHIHWIGKKVSQGWGAVRKWEINPISEDWSERKDGQLTRAIPAPDGEFLFGIRPPYWKTENQTWCIMPE
jgi:CRISPR type IV-associated protein Csf3